jgi:hypothetical protein
MSISFSPSHKNIVNTENNNNNYYEIKEQISDVLKQKKITRIKGKEVLNKVDNKIKKDKLILQLKKDCKFHKEEEKKKLRNLTEVTLSKEEYEKNKIIAEEFFHDIKNLLGEFGEKLNFYEKKITELKNERNNILTSSNSILEKKSNDKYYLDKQNNEINSKIKKQITILDDLNKRVENIEKQKEDEEKVLIGKENKDMDKYNKLFKKYREMLTKYNVYEKEETENEKDEIAKSRKEYEENLIKEDLKMKLNEAKQKNINLKKNLEEITNKVEAVSKEESIIINPKPILDLNKERKRTNILSGSTVHSTTAGYKDLISS